ncbi:hypothetical protein ACET70_18670, partial [Aeromonas caviae]|uniref:hypothetical protein n=1 Tax=Aeromonas caviae TaxID=648 RepID=UPI0038D14F82
RLRIEIAGAAMMIYLQKRVIDQNGRSPSSTENSKIRCGMTDRDLRFSPLAYINMDFLISWCCARNEPRVWVAIAASINLWEKDGEIEGLRMSELALRLLESSPDPAIVLEIFAESVTPSSWSGSRAKVMQSRAEAIRKLVEHDRADISSAAQTVSENLVQFIERQKEREQREDMEQEQRFE